MIKSQKQTVNLLKFLILLIVTSSCAKDVIDPNKDFVAKYGEKVKSIVSSLPNTSNKLQVQNKTPFGAVTREDALIESIEQDQQFYPYFDVNKFGQAPPKRYLPTKESYDQTRFSGPSTQIPDDIFDVTYQNRHYSTFRYQGARFDKIAIPPYDVYGVETAMTNKSYLLAGNNSLQKSVDNVNKSRAEGDVEISETLIKENKELRHKRKMVKIFGHEAVIENDEEEISSKESTKDSNNISQDS